MEAPNRSRTLFRLAQILFGLNAAIWLAFGMFSLNRLSATAVSTTLWIVALLMLGNAGAMLLCAWLLRRPGRVALGVTTAVLAANILLTFTDQVGFFDIATFLLDVVIAGVVFAAFRALRV